MSKDIDSGRYSCAECERGYKNTIIINEYSVDWGQPVILVEGYFDAIRTQMSNVIPLLGSTLRIDSKLFETIVKNNTPVFFALDPDAKRKQIHIIKSFVSYKVPCYIVNVEPYKDVGCMPNNEFKGRYRAAKQIEEFDLLKQEFGMIK